MVDNQTLLIDACIAEGVPWYMASDYSIYYRKLEYGQLAEKDRMKHNRHILRESMTKSKVFTF